MIGNVLETAKLKLAKVPMFSYRPLLFVPVLLHPYISFLEDKIEGLKEMGRRRRMQMVDDTRRRNARN